MAEDMKKTMDGAKPKEEEDKTVTTYRSRDGQELTLSFDIVRKHLVVGHPEWVTQTELIIYMGTCKGKD